MYTKWERRDEKKKRAWYKKQMANNRKSLEVLIEARRSREAKLKRDSNNWSTIDYE